MKHLCLLVLTIFPFLLFGQIRHEVKLDLIPVFSKVASISYETIVHRKIGIETDLEFSFRDGLLAESSEGIDGEQVFMYVPYDRNDLKVGLAGKYYFKPFVYGDGFFAGPYAAVEILTKIDKNFAMIYQEVYQKGVPDWTKREVKYFNYGMTAGYKRRFKRRFVLEVSFLMFFEKSIGTTSDLQIGTQLGSDLNLKVGYFF